MVLSIIFDKDGKIAEHWDVMETIADQADWQNQNGACFELLKRLKNTNLC